MPIDKLTNKVDVEIDGMEQYLVPFVQYDRTWSVAHHLRFLITANVIKESNMNKILDVGAGKGLLINYLKFMNINNIECSALELNKNYIENLKILYSKVYNESIEEHSKRNIKYDIIILGEVIEHIPKNKVNEFMKAIINVLNKNGKIILSTPNKINMVINWPEDHIDEFSYYELINLFNNCNLDIEVQYGLWRNTHETRTEIMDLSKQYKYIPTSIVNVLTNLNEPKKSKALLFILSKK